MVKLDTVHLLAGLIMCKEGRVREVLASLGVAPEDLLGAAHATVAHGQEPAVWQGLAPHGRAAIEAAVHAAARLRFHYIGTQHLMLGLLEQETAGHRFALRSLHLDPKRLHAEMRRSLLQDVEEQIRLAEQEPRGDAQDQRAAEAGRFARDADRTAPQPVN